MTKKQSKTDIGFGKKVRAIWLDLALDLAAKDTPFFEAKPALSEVIARDNPGPEAIRKVLAGLNRVWFNPPDYCRATRDAAFDLYRQPQPRHQLLLHWGMTISAYPFIGAIAEAVGRLLRLQNTALMRDVKRRMGERFGDRGFVERIVRFDVSSFLDWGVLLEGNETGEYAAAPRIVVTNRTHAAWLVEALLHARTEGAISLAQIRNHPMLFPFAFDSADSALALLKANPRLQSMRQNQTEELVMLAQ